MSKYGVRKRACALMRSTAAKILQAVAIERSVTSPQSICRRGGGGQEVRKGRGGTMG